MDIQIKTLSKTIEEELINPTFDLVEYYGELAVEHLLNNEALREVPIVKTLVGIVKGTLAIREVFLVNKILTFLHYFHAGKIPDSERADFMRQIQSDDKHKDRVIAQILIMNDRFVDKDKSRIHANLLLAHIHQQLSWEELSDALISLDSTHLRSIHYLDSLGQSTPQFQTENTDVPFEAALMSSGLATQRASCYVISELGRKLYYYGLKADFNATIPPVDIYDHRSAEEKSRSESYLKR